jgi:CheY-specific phosphatase CheX
MTKHITDEYFKHVIEGCTDFLENSVNIALSSQPKLYNPECINDKNKTVILSTSGTKINLLIGFSYDDKLLEQMAIKFGLPITDETRNEMLDTTACEVANMIIGNAIIHFPNDGSGVNLSPPLVINGIKTLKNQGTTHIAKTTIHTECGDMIVDIINN